MDTPSPDLTAPVKLPAELRLVETIYSDDQWLRVLIAEDKNGVLRILPERWDVSDVEFVGYAYWSPWGNNASFTDNLDTARVLARENRRIMPRSWTPDHEL